MTGRVVMPRRSHRVVLWSGVGAALIGLGILGGVTVERMRFDVERDRVLARYTQAAERLRGHLMAIEHDVATRRGEREP